MNKELSFSMSVDAPRLEPASSAATSGIDLSDPDLYAWGDPHRVWRRLREVAPVWFNAEAHGPGFWAVTAYAPAVQAGRPIPRAGACSR